MLRFGRAVRGLSVPKNVRKARLRRAIRGQLPMEAVDTGPPPALDLRSFTGTRQVTIGAAAFDNTAAAKALAAQIGRWRGNPDVEVIQIDGKFGSFDALEAESLDDAFTLYSEIARTPKCISIVGGVLTAGGVGLCSPYFTIVSDETVFVPPLAADVLATAPRYADGGLSYRLAQAGAAGRCAALSGVPVRGFSLVSAGLASHIVSPLSFTTVAEEIHGLAEVNVHSEPIYKDPEGLTHETVREFLDEAQEVGQDQLETNDYARAFDSLAESCFVSSDLDTILSTLKSSMHPMAADAAKHIQAAGVDAYVMADLLKRAVAKDGLFACLEMERTVSSWLLEPASTRPQNFMDYFD